MNKLSFVVLVLIGCGGKKEEGAAAKGADKPADKPAETAGDKAAEKPAAKPPKPADTSHGTCQIIGSGDVTFDQTMPHTGGSMLNVFQWHTEEMRTKIGYANEGMILNCLGKDIRLNVITKKDGAFPTKPAKYTLGKGSPLGIMGSIKNPAGGEDILIMGTEGTIDITHFDDRRIAGTGEINLVKTMPQKNIKLTLKFDMQCYGLSGCPK